jgi:hypothetical protein
MDTALGGISSLCDFCNEFDLLNLGHSAELIFPASKKDDIKGLTSSPMA